MAHYRIDLHLTAETKYRHLLHIHRDCWVTKWPSLQLRFMPRPGTQHNCLWRCGGCTEAGGQATVLLPYTTNHICVDLSVCALARIHQQLVPKLAKSFQTHRDSSQVGMLWRMSLYAARSVYDYVQYNTSSAAITLQYKHRKNVA